MHIGIHQIYWGHVGGGQRYIGVAAQLLAQNHEVEIVHHCGDFSRAKIEEAMELDLSRVGFRHVPAIERPSWPTRNPLKRLQFEREFRAEISRPYDLFIDNSDVPPLFCHAMRGVLVIHFPLVRFEEFHGHTSDDWRRRPAPLRWAAGHLHRHEWRRRLGSYQHFIVNSAYGRYWLKRRWGLDAVVLNPPLRNGFAPGPKEPILLSIGAFRSGAHKRHGVTIDVFKGLCDRGLNGWRYTLVGACGSNPNDRAYLEGLRRQATGYPIDFREDLSGSELKSLLERSTVLWHSMGYGVDARRHPELLEHFGMVATEAMAAGTVPIVFDGGGLREIVDHGRTGFLWKTTDELAAQTLTLLHDDGLQATLRANALAESTRYSTEMFAARLNEALAPVLR